MLLGLFGQCGGSSLLGGGESFGQPSWHGDDLPADVPAFIEWALAASLEELLAWLNEQ